jgi:hypothetical protein
MFLVPSNACLRLVLPDDSWLQAGRAARDFLFHIRLELFRSLVLGSFAIISSRAAIFSYVSACPQTQGA